MRNEMTTSRQKKKRAFSQGKEGEGKEDGNT
jgi:hypothetical protein